MHLGIRQHLVSVSVEQRNRVARQRIPRLLIGDTDRHVQLVGQLPKVLYPLAALADRLIPERLPVGLVVRFEPGIPDVPHLRHESDFSPLPSCPATKPVRFLQIRQLVVSLGVHLQQCHHEPRCLLILRGSRGQPVPGQDNQCTPKRGSKTPEMSNSEHIGQPFCASAAAWGACQQWGHSAGSPGRTTVETLPLHLAKSVSARLRRLYRRHVNAASYQDRIPLCSRTILSSSLRMGWLVANLNWRVGLVAE